jgi:hypothetical protein
MAGVSIPLHGDNPLVDEAYKNEFCVPCNRIQDKWEVFQDEKAQKWFKKCSKCKSLIPIKDEKLVQALEEEKEKLKNKPDKEKKK